MQRFSIYWTRIDSICPISFFNYAEQIADVTGPYEENDYYSILIAFAKLRRSELREAEIRFKKCMEACDKDEFRTPYRFASPMTDCGFVFIPMQRKYIDTRIDGLHNFTSLAKYDFRVTKQVGVSFMKDNGICMVHWCFMEYPWTHDEQMEKLLRENNPFRPVKTSELEHFKLRNERDAT